MNSDNKAQGYKQLEQNLVDLIKEEQAKLGYRKEAIRFYYPLSSLQHFFAEKCTVQEMLYLLEDFPKAVEERLGSLKITNEKERFCFHISEQGVVYVHDHTQENEFIKELVEVVGRHGCTIEEIKALFLAKSPQAEMKKVDNGEFDYLIRFTQEEIDPYYYCFKDEGCHIIYHRFLPLDYADFGF